MSSYTFLFLIFSILRINSQTTSKTCLVCASEGLRSRWSLTGLPISSISDSQFSSECDNLSNGIPSSIQRQSCSGPCYTYMFDDPDSRSDSPSILYIRGCHDEMTGVVSDRLTSGGATNGMFCEYDSTYSRPDSRGKIVTSRTLVEFCGTIEDGCNKRYKMPSSSGTNDVCNGQTYNNTLSGSLLNCYECSKDSGSCNESRCYKKYCSKAVVAMKGEYSIRKMCSNVNVLGLDNACSMTDVITVPGGNLAVTMKYTQCYCKDKQYCNGDQYIHQSYIIFFIISSITSLLI